MLEAIFSLKVILILVMIPISLGTQYMFMVYTRSDYWFKLSKAKKTATLGMGSIASTLTGLWLFDYELSETRFMFFMLVASLIGGEGVQVIVNGEIAKWVNRFSNGAKKEK